jgi:DNA-binding transcriptional regulator YiaG
VPCSENAGQIMELNSMPSAIKALLGTEFAALLVRATISQAGFARLAGVTARQVNNWCCGRAAVPKWASALALVLAEISPEELEIRLEEADFGWHEVLGVPADADAATAGRAMTRLVLAHHPDAGGDRAQMTRINAAYAAARAKLEDRPADTGPPPRP